MAQYFGSELHVRLQATVDRSMQWLEATPGACNAGRAIGCDDIDMLGWEGIHAVLDRDGLLAFRLVPTDRLDALSDRLADHGFGLDLWDVLVGEAGDVMGACEPILAAGPPSGLSDLDPSDDPDADAVTGLQSLMLENGIAPFSGMLLTGGWGPVALTGVADDAGRPVASAFAYFPHNRHSRWKRYAWCGLVAVDPAWRGRGLGRYVNARAAAAICGPLGAAGIYELVAPTNSASRRMVESCGLRIDPSLKSGLATRGGLRYTR